MGENKKLTKGYFVTAYKKKTNRSKNIWQTKTVFHSCQGENSQSRSVKKAKPAQKWTGNHKLKHLASLRFNFPSPEKKGKKLAKIIANQFKHRLHKQ